MTPVQASQAQCVSMLASFQAQLRESGAHPGAIAHLTAAQVQLSAVGALLKP